jgi:hypothetical protein
MVASTTLLQFLLMVVAGWLHRQQVATIDYLKAENRMLRACLGMLSRFMKPRNAWQYFVSRPHP